MQLIEPVQQIFTVHGISEQHQYPNYNEARNIKHTTLPELTPYLGPRSRLSQLWFNRWTLLLALIVARVILSTQSLGDDIDSAQREALSACTSVERAGSAMASMPHYMAVGVNELTAKSIEGAVRALHQMILMSITGVQEIVVFVINMIVQTYVCLLTLAISGSIGVVLDATEKIADFVNKTIGSITQEIGEQAESFENVLNNIIKGAGTAGNLFGGEIEIPTLDLPSLDRLKDIKIPSGFDDKLNELRDNLPTFREVKEAGEKAIRLPFQTIKQMANDSLGIYEFDRSVFPVPQKEKLSFCSDNSNISDFFDGLKDTVKQTRTTVIAILLTLAFLIMIPLAYQELRKYRIMRQRAYLYGENSRYDPVDVAYLASRPTTGTIGLRIANLARSERRQILVRWAVAYVTSPAALFVLSLGLAGLISALAQYIVLRQVEQAVPALAQEVGGFAGQVVDLLDKASEKFADSNNLVIRNVTDTLNEDMFGWLTKGAKSLNDTLNAFTEEMEAGIDKFLGGTILEKPAEDVIECLIGLKIESLQKGLTWIHENAKISFPEIPKDTFSLGALNSLDDNGGTGADSFLSDPEGASSDMITDTLYKMSIKLADRISTEAIISGVVTMIWVIVFLIALVRIACLWWGHDRVRGDGGAHNINYSSSNLRTGPSGLYPGTATTSSSEPFEPAPTYTAAAGPTDAFGLVFPHKVQRRSGPAEEFSLQNVQSKQEQGVPRNSYEWRDEKSDGVYDVKA